MDMNLKKGTTVIDVRKKKKVRELPDSVPSKDFNHVRKRVLNAMPRWVATADLSWEIAVSAVCQSGKPRTVSACALNYGEGHSGRIESNLYGGNLMLNSKGFEISRLKVLKIESFEAWSVGGTAPQLAYFLGSTLIHNIAVEMSAWYRTNDTRWRFRHAVMHMHSEIRITIQIRNRTSIDM